MRDAALRQAAVMLLAAKVRVDARRAEAVRAAADAVGVPARDETPLHAAADAHVDAMTLAVQYAFLKGRKAYRTGGARGAVAAVRAALLVSLPPVLLKLLAAGGQAGMKAVSRTVRAAALRAAAPQKPGQPHSTEGPFDLAFNVSDPNAVAWAEQHAGELAKDLSETSEQAIRDAVADALEGEGIDAAYDDILDAVGDESRAAAIARTETMWAANEGQQQAWDQAVDAGLLTGDERIAWIATSGACEVCEGLDGEERPVNGDYDDPDAADGPPQHPNCRCTEGFAS